MDGEDRRDRLARLQLERMNRPPAQGLRANVRRSGDAWARFMAGAGWEKLFFTGGVVLVAGLLIGALFMLTSNLLGGNGGKKHVSAGVVRPTATRAAAAPKPSPTAIVIGVPTLPTALPTSRFDCDKMRRTSYNNPDEQRYFEENCATPAGGPDQPTTEPPPAPATVPPTEPPPTPHDFNAGDAIQVASYWITHSAPESYSEAGACNAFDAGGHWVVTCSATLAGCQGAVCQRTISVCVFPDPLQVRPANQC